MSRRSFIQQVAAMLASITVAPRGKASELAVNPLAVITGTAARSIELQRSPVAGFQYHQGESLWAALEVGAQLELIREPENVYDKYAVRVDWQGHKLGYVPRAENAAVSHLLDHGQTVTAEVLSLKVCPNPWDRIELALFLKL